MIDARRFYYDNPDIVKHVYERFADLPLPETMTGSTVYIYCDPRRYIEETPMINKPAKKSIRNNKFKRKWWE